MQTIKHEYAVGDDVSYGFNGDWYYGGKVARITKKFLTTDRGQKFYLWAGLYTAKINDEYQQVIKETFRSIGGGTWVLTKGIKEEQNPHF